MFDLTGGCLGPEDPLLPGQGLGMARVDSQNRLQLAQRAAKLSRGLELGRALQTLMDQAPRFVTALPRFDFGPDSLLRLLQKGLHLVVGLSSSAWLKVDTARR